MRRPFEFVRFLLHDDDDVDNKDPPSASELRNVSIVRSIPFVIPFMQRIEVSFSYVTTELCSFSEIFPSFWKILMKLLLEK